LDPRGVTRPENPERLDVQPHLSLDPSAPRPADSGRAQRPGFLIGSGLLLVLVVLIGSVLLLAPAGNDQGVRGLAARIRGEDWERAGLRGASAEFPAPPIHRIVPIGPGLPNAGDVLSATGAGLRTELLVGEVGDGSIAGGPAALDSLVTGYAATRHGQVDQRSPSSTAGMPALDAVITTAAGPVRVWATVVGSTGYLMSLMGPPGAFERFTASFQRPSTRSAGPVGRPTGR